MADECLQAPCPKIFSCFVFWHRWSEIGVIPMDIRQGPLLGILGFYFFAGLGLGSLIWVYQASLNEVLALFCPPVIQTGVFAMEAEDL
jgi:hypothetical protein